jgi:hypothetical protein
MYAEIIETSYSAIDVETARDEETAFEKVV